MARPSEVVPLNTSTLSMPAPPVSATVPAKRSEEHTSELQSRFDLVCRLPPSSPLFPYTTLFRSRGRAEIARLVGDGDLEIAVGAGRQRGVERPAAGAHYGEAERGGAVEHLDLVDAGAAGVGDRAGE